jgi:hypothetical protein
MEWIDVLSSVSSRYTVFVLISVLIITRTLDGKHAISISELVIACYVMTLAAISYFIF